MGQGQGQGRRASGSHQCLEELGHEVVVADPNFAPMYGTRTRRVKTDKRDARALANACVSGTYREAHRTSEGGGNCN